MVSMEKKSKLSSTLLLLYFFSSLTLAHSFLCSGTWRRLDLKKLSGLEKASSGLLYQWKQNAKYTIINTNTCAGKKGESDEIEEGGNQTFIKDDSSRLSLFSRSQILYQVASMSLGFSLGFDILNRKLNSQAGAIDDGPSARKLLSETASKIPGYGESDIYYPPFFLGDWEVTKEFADFTIDTSAVSQSDLENSAIIREEIEKAEKEKGVRISSLVRFIRSSDGNRVIADRGRNEAEFLRSYYKTLSSIGRSTVDSLNSPKDSIYDDIIQSQWDSSNPNILTITLPNNVLKELKVTKRAADDKGDDGRGNGPESLQGVFGTSEFYRVAESDSSLLSSVPKISSERVLTRYKPLDESLDNIQAIQLLKVYPPLGNFALGEPKSFLTKKIRLTMKRKVQN